MGRKRKAVQSDAIENDWTVSFEYTNTKTYAKTITVGTELSIRGERGRFRFMKYVSRPNGIEWIDVWGGPKGAESTRSFRPERIKTVHRIGKTDKAILAARKAAKQDA